MQLNINDYYTDFVQSFTMLGYNIRWAEREFCFGDKLETVPVRVILNPVDGKEILLYTFFELFVNKICAGSIENIKQIQMFVNKITIQILRKMKLYYRLI